VNRHRVWLPLTFLLASFAVVFVLYGRMPERVPTHWNIRGEIDGWMPKPWGPLALPLVHACTLAVLAIAPLVSPKDASMAPFARYYAILVAAISGFLFALNVVVCLVGAGAKLDAVQLVSLMSGALFLVLGNFMGKLTKNYFAGIRTPWTLENEEVWHRTHRLGGKLFVLAGLLTIVSALTGAGLPVLIATVLATTIVTTAYSYFLYKRLRSSARP
jgi:uncharacterized membrane protein